MATQILAVGSTIGETVPFSLAEDTLVWVHRSLGSAQIGLNIKGSDGAFSPLTVMTDAVGRNSGVLPKGDYQAVRISGTCGFQSA